MKLSNKKEQTIDICNKTDEPKMHPFKWKKAHVKDYTLYVLYDL